ncbi:hypothetical protein IW262DRAFT_1267118, partial [Armillaria fumosa]
QIVACFLNWGLFGTLSVQFYLYYLAFPKDRKFTKYLVYGIYAVEFGQTMLITYDAFLVFGYGFGDMKVLTGMHSHWLTVLVTSAAVAYVGQGFYAYRIFVLSKSRTVPAFVICVRCGILSLWQFDSSICSRKTSISVGVSNQIDIPCSSIWCGASALCDVIIAIYMTYYLMRSNTGFRRTRVLITKLIRLTVETGSVTATVALLNLILFSVFPHQTFYGTPALIMTKLYANTVYMVLNSRIRIMGGRDTYTSSTDMSFTSTMARDITSQSIEGARPTDMQGRAPVVTIAKEAFSDDYETSRTNKVSNGDPCVLFRAPPVIYHPYRTFTA